MELNAERRGGEDLFRRVSVIGYDHAASSHIVSSPLAWRRLWIAEVCVDEMLWAIYLAQGGPPVASSRQDRETGSSGFFSLFSMLSIDF